VDAVTAPKSTTLLFAAVYDRVKGVNFLVSAGASKPTQRSGVTVSIDILHIEIEGVLAGMRRTKKSRLPLRCHSHQMWFMPYCIPEREGCFHTHNKE
jgi:hypothetical protein